MAETFREHTVIQYISYGNLRSDILQKIQISNDSKPMWY